MLQRTHLFVLATVLTAAAACTTKSTDSDIPPGSGGSGNSGNIGNTGGDTTGGAGGTGGEGAAGGAGGGACVGPEDGSGQTAAVCDGMNITPSCVEGGVAAVCNAGGSLFYPPGWRTCHRAFDIFHAGAVDVLVACLEDIGVNPEACEDAPVGACVGEMYAAACDNNTDANDTCAAINQGCVDVGENDFDLDGCYADLKPFSADGVDAYIACQNDHLDDPCAGLHDTCIGEVVTFNALPAACDEAPE